MPLMTENLMNPENRPDAPRRRNRKGEDTRRRILEAAVTCLKDQGYAACSVEAVMQTAGLSRGSVLNQFATRLDLMAGAADHAMQHMIADSSQRMNHIEGAREKLFRHVDVIWESQQIPEASAVTEILLASRWDHDLADRLKDVVRTIEHNIDHFVGDVARQAGISRIEEYQLHVRVLVLSLRGIAIERMFDNDRDIMQRALERIRQMHERQCHRLLESG